MRLTADISLDIVDSSGGLLRPLPISGARFMAFSLEGGGMWYGFVVSESGYEYIEPGMTLRVSLSFLDPSGAMKAFPYDSSFIFGNGVVSYGVAVLRRPDEAEYRDKLADPGV